MTFSFRLVNHFLLHNFSVHTFIVQIQPVGEEVVMKFKSNLLH